MFPLQTRVSSTGTSIFFSSASAPPSVLTVDFCGEPETDFVGEEDVLPLISLISGFAFTLFAIPFSVGCEPWAADVGPFSTTGSFDEGAGVPPKIGWNQWFLSVRFLFLTAKILLSKKLLQRIWTRGIWLSGTSHPTPFIDLLNCEFTAFQIFERLPKCLS